jgi:hypothetical protein
MIASTSGRVTPDEANPDDAYAEPLKEVGSGPGVFGRRFVVPLTLDVDGDETIQPLTDGLLILRYDFGFRGATLISGAVASGCTRCNAPTIEAYLAAV